MNRSGPACSLPLTMIGLAGIATPIIISVIIEPTGTFHYVLLYAAASAMLAIVADLPIVGEIRCLGSPRDLIAGSNA